MISHAACGIGYHEDCPKPKWCGCYCHKRSWQALRWLMSKIRT